MATSLVFRLWGSLFRALLWLTCRVEVSTFPVVDDKPVVMVANHRSFLDGFLSIALLAGWRYPARCMVRDRYFKRPILGRVLTALGCIPVGGGSDALSQASDALQAGIPLAIMAEGRIVPPEQRQPDGIGRIHRGFVKIARDSDATIVPLGVTGTDVVWPRDEWPKLPWRGRPTVRVEIGEPIDIEEMTDREALDETRVRMAALIS